MPGPKINEKLGLKPATRPRAMMRNAGKDAAAALKTSRQLSGVRRAVGDRERDSRRPEVYVLTV